MPRKIELRVEAHNHYTKGLRKGDFLTLPRGISGMIESMEAKQAYLHVTLVGGTKGRLPLGSEINVTREVPTDDEQDEMDLAKITEMVAKESTKVKARMESDVAVLAQIFKSRMEDDRLDPFDFSMAAQIKLTEYSWRLWAEVLAHLVDVAAREDTRRGAAALRGLMRVRFQCERDLTRSYQRSLSKSTSVIGNIEDDMKREAASTFLEETKYWGVEGVWERIGGIL